MKISALFLLSLLLSLTVGYELKRALAPVVNWNEHPFTVLILGVGKANAIQHICTGSVLNTDGKASHVLTSAYCIQNRTDPDDPSAFLRMVVLVPAQNGTIILGGNTFQEFLPFQMIRHPSAGQESNYTFLSALPNGTAVPVYARIDTNDVGIIRLRGLINVTGVKHIPMSFTRPSNGSKVDLLGFGGPGFYSLHKTNSLIVIPSVKNVNGAEVANNDIIFFRDPVSPRNASQAIEVGDEGGPIMTALPNGTLAQVGIAQGTWRMSEGNQTITYASLGPAIANYQEFIQKVLAEPFVLPTQGNDTNAAPSQAASTVLALLSLIVMALL